MSEFFHSVDYPPHPHAAPVICDGRQTTTEALDGAPTPKIEQLAHERTAEFLRLFFETIMGDVPLNRGCQREIGRRFIVAMWVVNPRAVGGGEEISLTRLAGKFRYKAPTLSPLAAEISRRLAIQNHYQVHDKWKGGISAASAGTDDGGPEDLEVGAEAVGNNETEGQHAED